MKLPRRKFLHLAAGAGASTAITASDLTWAQAPAPRAKGPLVWLDMGENPDRSASTAGLVLRIASRKARRSGTCTEELDSFP